MICMQQFARGVTMNFLSNNITTLQKYCMAIENRLIEKDKYISQLEAKLELKDKQIKKLMRERKGE